MENYLIEAFQKLSLLNEDDFDITADRDVIDELQSFVADDVDEIPEEPVIDTLADDEEELSDNYVGKVILECECCHTRLYKEESEVFVDEESGLANIEEACPVCNNTMGYTVIGKIEKFDEEPEEEDDEISFEDAELDAADEEPVESLRDRLKKRRALGEAKKIEENVELPPDDVQLREKKKVCPECGKEPCECESVADEEGLNEDSGLERLRKVYGGKVKKESCDEEVDESLKEGNENAVVFDRFGDTIIPGQTYITYDSFEERELPELAYKFIEEVEPDLYKFEPATPEARELSIKLAEDDPESWDGKYVYLDSNSVFYTFFDGKEGTEVDKLIKNWNETDESLKEGIENLSMDTDDTHVEMTSDEDGATHVSVEPKVEEEIPDLNGEEEIVPLSDEEQDNILANEPEDDLDDLDFEEEPFDDELGAEEDEFAEEEPEEEGEEEEELPEESLKGSDGDTLIEEFDEVAFNDLCESYLRKVYDNVNTFETVSVKDNKDEFVVEGLIKYKNGKEAKSTFVFTEANETKTGKVVMEGYNKTFSNSPKTFKVKGIIDNNNYISEALAYKYTASSINESNEVEVTKVQGKVKRLK